MINVFDEYLFWFSKIENSLKTKIDQLLIYYNSFPNYYFEEPEEDYFEPDEFGDRTLEELEYSTIYDNKIGSIIQFNEKNGALKFLYTHYTEEGFVRNNIAIFLPKNFSLDKENIITLIHKIKKKKEV